MCDTRGPGNKNTIADVLQQTYEIPFGAAMSAPQGGIGAVQAIFTGDGSSVNGHFDGNTAEETESNTAVTLERPFIPPVIFDRDDLKMENEFFVSIATFLLELQAIRKLVQTT
ncbi:hypothetical protein EJ02DRAFT_452017 [Clathrospora elynae]|uniref:Uncharacterized protein n=1 Tax=Clathrospora elynae TaxID=706981 RepID=A0A6A5SY86_9PLEO|nr:hypothetical protein EJ02DRAFT_452017 [Clathrospora elynae]